MSSCSSPICYPTDTGCAQGCADLKACPNWTGSLPEGESKQNAPATSHLSSQVTWTGRALGTVDLLPISSRGYLKVVGLIGPANAGKTSFLIALYLILLKEAKIGPYTFAGSYTLAGWERLASYLRHSAQQPWQFPPHTTSMDRVPSLLHLSVRDEEGKLSDIVFTDTPGEWFSRWSVNVNDPNASGARWIIEKSDAFLLFADSSALSGAQRGLARQSLFDLMRRFAGHIKNRPAELIWTKNDLSINENIKNQISSLRQELLPLTKERSVSILSTEGCFEISNVVKTLLDEMLTSKTELADPFKPKSPFLAYRGTL